MAELKHTPALLAGLPVEILLEIYQHLDIYAAMEFSLTNKEFHCFFQCHKIDIVLPILARDFAPLDELLQVYTASRQDIDNKRHYKPRKVVFHRSLGDGTLVSGAKICALMTADREHGSRSFQSYLRRKTAQWPEWASKKITLTEHDLSGLLKCCRLVDEWESLFPQMRWHHQPEDCRLLRPHERIRFRRALYRWWMYGIHFHEEPLRQRLGYPEPRVDDVRTSQMRYHSTAELLELMDFLETIKDIILHYICPRLDPTSHLQASLLSPPVGIVARPQSLRNSWNDQSRWGRIVKTYSKLGPKDLLYYLNNIGNYPRSRLIADIWMHHPFFTFNQDSIQVAIRCALDERKWLNEEVDLAEHGIGGIVDFDDERDNKRVRKQDDASPDGLLPKGLSSVQSQSQYSPLGDDGSSLEDFLRFPASRLHDWTLPALEGSEIGAGI